MIDENIEKVNVIDWMNSLPTVSEEQRQKNLAEREKALKDPFGDFYSELAEKVGKPGWNYRDIPWTTIDYANQLIDIIGEEELIWLARTQRGNTVRGQILISPEGMENIKEWNSNGGQ